MKSKTHDKTSSLHLTYTREKRKGHTMPTNGFNMRQHWMLPIVLAPNVLSQAPPAKVVVVDIEHFQSLQAGPFQPLMHMSVGEPPQPIKCIFDTGSSDIIVPQAGSAVCNLPNQQCRKAPVVTGDFEPAKSSDVKEVNNSTFNATFSGGDGFDGPFVKTTIGIGGAKVVESQVALAVNGSLPGDFPQFPICGVGPVESEQTDNKYVNMVAKMKENGVIGSNAMGVVLSRNRESSHPPPSPLLFSFSIFLFPPTPLLVEKFVMERMYEV
ncbi:hypothetical protein J3458_002278 [Metarhizium acridum]|uniref:uncharacterized protein n=1 Tax=Metarhizium acridum TaxID=92637 RepID=UPI001C6CA7B0|nr:hypothetical protein J3458_002278 [Metarhizium acridum]